MEDFEKKLKQIPLVQPSENLYNRIFGKERKKFVLTYLFNRKISLTWAFSLAVIFLAAGFILSSFLYKAGGIIYNDQQKSVKIEVVQTANGNFMDFTKTSDYFLNGDITVNLKSGEKQKDE